MPRIPLLSVFMPVFNGEKFVREAIESVLDNGFADLELVVVDDGSTDETVRIVESVRHPALRFVRQPTNLGIPLTRQNGISHLRGRYMGLLDADDIAVPGRFERQINRLEASDGPDIVGGALERFGDDDRLGTVFYPFSDDRCKTMLLFNPPVINSAVCMRLAPLREGRICYSKYGDYALWIDAMRAGLRFENLDWVVTRYRRHGGSITATRHDLMVEKMRVMRHRIAEIYFPMFSINERDALVDAYSCVLSGGPRWINSIFALSRAAMLAKDVPGIGHVWMVELLENHLLKMIERAINHGEENNETLEMMTETSEHFAQWRAADDGALDKRIMALSCLSTSRATRAN